MIGEPLVNTLFTAYLVSVLAFCSLPDLRYFTIPNVANFANLIGALAYTTVSPQGFTFHFWGGVIGFGSFVALSSAFKFVRGYDGVGLGDAKFMAGAGAWVGWTGLPPLILIASLSALLYISARQLLTRQYDRTTRIPFAPFLSMATLVVWLTKISDDTPWLL